MTLGETFRAVLIEYRSPRRWLPAIGIAAPIVIFAAWLTYLMASLGLLDRSQFSPFNSRGYLRVVLLWFIVIIVAIPPFLIVFEATVMWLAAARSRARVAVSAGVVVLGVAGVVWLTELLAADRCLDRGGSFNYIEAECDPTSSHPFVPFDERHPFFSSAAVMTGLFSLAVAIEVKRQKRAV